jgi:perosamine synthetase
LPERLRLADPRFGDEALEAVERVLVSGRLTQGPMVEEFERAIADFCGVGHAVATTSATTALELVLASLDIGPGDEVVVANFTYPATANAVLQRGAEIRLVDANRDTYCLDIARLREALSEATSAVIAVDLFGLPADYEQMEPLLLERGIPLICDAACSLGGALGERRTGSFGLASCFSFHPRKSLTTGEGGMVTTDDEPLAQRMRRLRNHGSERQGWRATFVEPGFNFRMSEINAALGLAQVPAFADVLKRRRELAAALTRRLEPLAGAHPQQVPEGSTHPYQAYVVFLDDGIDRDAIIAALAEADIESTLGTYALHAEPAFAQRPGSDEASLPVSSALARQTLALPLHDRLELDDVDRIARELTRAVTAARSVS